MEEKENDQDNNINNINAYSDYEHEAESMYISSPNDEDKKESNQIQKNDIPPEQRIADLKKKIVKPFIFFSQQGGGRRYSSSQML